MEPANLSLKAVEAYLDCSRDKVQELIAAGFLVAFGHGRGRRVTRTSLEALQRRIDNGEGDSIWQAARNASRAAPEPPRTARARSTKTREDGGTSPHGRAACAPDAFEPLTDKPPKWLKPIG